MADDSRTSNSDEEFRTGSASNSQTANPMFGGLADLAARLIILPVRAYQKFISPFIGKNCRFYPSCSQYFILAVKKYGAMSGSWRGIRRICRCHPWSHGGVDLP